MQVHNATCAASSPPHAENGVEKPDPPKVHCWRSHERWLAQNVESRNCMCNRPNLISSHRDRCCRGRSTYLLRGVVQLLMYQLSLSKQNSTSLRECLGGKSKKQNLIPYAIEGLREKLWGHFLSGNANGIVSASSAQTLLQQSCISRPKTRATPGTAFRQSSERHIDVIFVHDLHLYSCALE